MSAVTWMRVPSASGAIPLIGWLRTRWSRRPISASGRPAPRAAGPAPARQLERAARALGDVCQGRVGAGQLVGAVEDERPQPVWVADRERLRRVRAVRVAVEVDLADPDRVQHGRQILHGLGRVVVVAGRAELRGAAAGAHDVGQDVAAKRRAVERARAARAAQVDQHEVAPGRDRPPQLQPRGPVGGGREARATLDREHRRGGGLSAQRTEIVLEVDADRAPVREAAVERHAHEPALGERARPRTGDAHDRRPGRREGGRRGDRHAQHHTECTGSRGRFAPARDGAHRYDGAACRTRAIRICISGALGAVGRSLVRGVAAADGHRLHSAVARRDAGRDVGEVVLGRPLGVPIETDLAAALDRRPDVLIDYTHPAVVRSHVELALARSIPVVIGTTGLTDADFERIDAAARRRRRGRRHRELLDHRGAHAAPGPVRRPPRARLGDRRARLGHQAGRAQRHRARAGRAARPRAQRRAHP